MANSKRPKRRRPLRHVALEMGEGKVISLAGDQAAIDAALKTGDVPFSGEVMTCILCGKKRESAPAVESDWRAVQLGEGEEERRYYGCPDHFPPDGASREAFKAAYVVFLEKAIGLWRLGAKVK
jgi:hypothetical protein